MRTLFVLLTALSFALEAAPPQNVLGTLFVKRKTYLWNEPTAFGKAQAKLHPGLKVQVLKARTDAKFFRVKLSNGQDGYVLKQSLSRTRPRLAKVPTKNKPRVPASPSDEPPPMLEDIPIAPEAGEDTGEGAASAEVEDEMVEQNDFNGREDEPKAASTNPYAQPVEEGESSAEGTYKPQGAGSSVYEEYEDLFGEAVDSEDAQELDSKPESKKTQQSQKKSKNKGRRREEKSADVVFDDNRVSVTVNLEYANQFSHDSTHGWGTGFSGLYYILPNIGIGAAFTWNRFSETVEYTDVKIESSRNASRFLFGPLFRFALGGFRLDAVLGWDRTHTKFKVTNTETGADITSLAGTQYIGTFKENALGMNLKAAYAWQFDPKMALEGYLGYGVGFYGGESASGNKGSTPQQIMLGTAFTLGF